MQPPLRDAHPGKERTRPTAPRERRASLDNVGAPTCRPCETMRDAGSTDQSTSKRSTTASLLAGQVLDREDVATFDYVCVVEHTSAHSSNLPIPCNATATTPLPRPAPPSMRSAGGTAGEEDARSLPRTCRGRMAMQRRRLLAGICALAVAAAASAALPVARAMDADKAAELSREIREHFRASGINWISPKMLRVSRCRALRTWASVLAMRHVAPAVAAVSNGVADNADVRGAAAHA